METPKPKDFTKLIDAIFGIEEQDPPKKTEEEKEEKEGEDK